MKTGYKSITRKCPFISFFSIVFTSCIYWKRCVIWQAKVKTKHTTRVYCAVYVKSFPQRPAKRKEKNSPKLLYGFTANEKRMLYFVYNVLCAIYPISYMHAISPQHSFIHRTSTTTSLNSTYVCLTIEHVIFPVFTMSAICVCVCVCVGPESNF